MILDSRDLIQEREDLQQQIVDDYNDDLTYEEVIKLESFDSEFWEDELQAIEEIDDFENEVNTSEWDYGLQLIPEDEFEDYAKELVKDCGYLPENLPWWIKRNIDWEGIADVIRQDYSEVYFRGETYFYRG